MKTIYKVNGKTVSADEYFYAMYQNQCQAENYDAMLKWLEAHPEISEEAERYEATGKGKAIYYIQARWLCSNDSMNVKHEDPDSFARKIGACGLLFYIVIIIICIVSIANL